MPFFKTLFCLSLAMLCIGCHAPAPHVQPATDTVTSDILMRQLDYQNAQEAASVINELFPVHATAFESNSIVVTGPTEVLRLLEKTLDNLERNARPEDLDMKTIPLKNAHSDELAATLTQLLPRACTYPTDRQPPPVIQILSDPRTNSLIISSSKKYFDAIQKIIDELDKPIPQP